MTNKLNVQLRTLTIENELVCVFHTKGIFRRRAWLAKVQLDQDEQSNLQFVQLSKRKKKLI